MDFKPIALLYTFVFLLTSCAPYSSIDAKKMSTQEKTINLSSKTSPLQLTDKDIFGNETTLAVTEDDIQAALEGEGFHIPLGSKVILVQSGSRAPESIMQQEMSQYFTVATFSGIPDRQKVVSCSKVKEENQDATIAENMNWMQALRYVAAKGHQKAIIVYQDVLQSGKYDSATKTTTWSDYKNEKITDSSSLRYLIRFTLVDVASGDWASWSPVNYEYKALHLVNDKNESSDTTEQQISKIKQKTYAAMVKDLVNRYQ